MRPGSADSSTSWSRTSAIEDLTALLTSAGER
jgi:hypothetical protein